MKNLISSLLVTLIVLPFAAQAEQKLTCLYRAPVSGETGNVVMEFVQDDYGRPLSGLIRVQDASGRETRIPIRGRDISQIAINDQEQAAELVANVHIRSYDVDLVLNYVGNEFWYDAVGWFGTKYVGLEDLQDAYTEMSSSGQIHHRLEGWLQPVAQMTGSVRWNGSIRKFASSKFVCTTVMP